MKDSRSFLEERESNPVAIRLFKVTKRAQKITAACGEMGAMNIKVVHFSLHLFYSSCLLSSPESVSKLF